MTQPHDDEYGDVLRSVLRAEAEEVTPSAEGLERIRTRIADRSARRLWWQMPWIRPAMAVGGAFLLASVVMVGTPGIRGAVIAAFNGQSNTPQSKGTTPYHPPTNNGGYPTNAGSGTPSPTGSQGPSQGPAGGPCDPGSSDPGSGQVTTMRTPSSSGSPSDCPTTPPPDSGTTDPGTPTSTPPPDHPTEPTHTTEPTEPSGSPSTDPKPSDSNAVPEASP